MTEPNKELPKEVDELKPILRDKFREYISTYTIGKTQKTSLRYNLSDIAHDHYAPIIEARDKQLSEKDKIIAELEAEKYRQNEKYEELARLYGKTVNNLSAANTGKKLLKAERRKLMGLLKEEVMNRAAWDENDTSYWNNYCKENDIPVGE